MVVSEEEIEKAFKGTNFGHTNYRELLNASVMKKLLDYHCWWTITCIMKELGLIGKTEKVTEKGKLLVREAYHELMIMNGRYAN